MTLITVAEARENLPDLLRRAAAGEQIVITEGDKWLAALGKAPPPPTAEEIAATVARAEEQVRKYQQLQTDEPGLVDRETVQRWFDEQRR